jgi:plastocyanin
MRTRSLALTLVALVLLSACGTAAAPSSPSASASAAGAATVDYQGFKAQPATLEVTKGTKVTWTNKDTTAHTVTSGTNRQSDGKFDGQIGAGETFSFTFNDAGTFEYFCSKHSSMVGFKVVVK